ncbi:MAG: TonB-dependent receptor [Acidobacteria bacterium]|nr:TonB-dependent receptor [Acidobacteriota bacterium]
MTVSPQTRLSLRGNKYDNRIPYDARYTGGSDRTPASAIGVNRRSRQVFSNLTQVIGSRAVNQVKAGYNQFHWNQYPHVKNSNSLVGQLSGLGAPVIQLTGLTLGQTHAITPQDIGQDLWSIRDDFATSFNRGGRHDVRLGTEYIHDFTFETVCQNCMGTLDLRGGPIPANLEELIPNVHDVSTWNLGALNALARSYTRNIAMTSSPYSRPSGSGGFTEYAPREVVALWAQDDWAMSDRFTLNLGLRYDVTIGAFVNWVDFPPFLTGNRPNDTNNFAPRVGFAYSLDDRTVLRGGAGKYFGEITSQPAIFTLRYVQQIQPQILPDGRADFVTNPFNGPAPTYDEALALTCAQVANPLSRTCIRPNLQNFAADDLEQPYSYQASVGVQRQVAATMSVEADYVFSDVRNELGARNINIAYNQATGLPYPVLGGGVDFSKRVYPEWGTTAVNRADNDTRSHSLQTSFTRRMANRWQASATYTLSAEWNFDQLPLNPGCQYPMTIAASGAAVCNVPVTLPKDIAENDWYRTGAQRQRATFNGIYDAGYGFQLSGLYIYGDNGKATPQAGVDPRGIGNNNGRLRADGSLIERNSLNLPSLHRVDLRLQRRFALGSGASLDGIFEMFNVFNRVNFESLQLNERNSRFGLPNQSSSVAYAPRMLQLGFRAAF